jgi:rhodanese-related sulfurtransferase
MRKAAIALICVWTLCAAAPALGAGWHPALENHLQAISQQVKSIDMDSFARLLESTTAVMIVDVREYPEYEESHVPGAVNVPRGIIEFKIWDALADADRVRFDTPIYVYCGLGDRSILAAKSLQELGFTNVQHVDMRFRDWEQSGFPIDF